MRRPRQSLVSKRAAWAGRCDARCRASRLRAGAATAVGKPLGGRDERPRAQDNRIGRLAVGERLDLAAPTSSNIGQLTELRSTISELR